jgi:hypothetical protein
VSQGEGPEIKPQYLEEKKKKAVCNHSLSFWYALEKVFVSTTAFHNGAPVY